MLGFRSKLELRFSIMLKEAKIAYEYETEKFTLMDKFKQEHWARFGKKFKRLESVRTVTYTPDFIIWNKKQKFIIEIKGFRTDSYKIKMKLFLNWLRLNDPEAIFVEINTITEMNFFINKIY
mgnify:CR=1 FL=1